MNDSQIIDLLFARSEQGILELSQKYDSQCKSIAKNILNNTLDAEECVNDAYFGIWNSIPPQKPNPLFPYLFRIVRNLSLKKYHANTAVKRNSSYDIALSELKSCLASAQTVEETCSAKELSELIDHFLDTLPKKDRILFVRRYWYADPISDLAKTFQMTDNAVSVRLLRIREKLKKYLKKEGFFYE